MWLSVSTEFVLPHQTVFKDPKSFLPSPGGVYLMRLQLQIPFEHENHIVNVRF